MMNTDEYHSVLSVERRSRSEERPDTPSSERNAMPDSAETSRPSSIDHDYEEEDDEVSPGPPKAKKV